MNTCAVASAANEPAWLSPMDRGLTPSSVATARRNIAVPVGNVFAASAGKNNDLTVGKLFGGPFRHD